jgi:hypothetical protein
MEQIMFEQEIELEKRQSAAIPLLLMAGLIIALVGVAGYYLVQSRKVLTTSEAANAVQDILKAQASTTVSFHTGRIRESFDESPRDARYRLLEKTGVLKVGKANNAKTSISLTSKGLELLKQIPGTKQSDEAEGNVAYVVPLAIRKLVEISNVTMSGPEHAIVQYTWRWEPNALGENFDVATLSGFNTSDRVVLIDKYGARYYHSDPVKATVALVKTTRGWLLAAE